MAWDRTHPGLSFSVGDSPLNTWVPDAENKRWVPIAASVSAAQAVLEKYARELKLVMATIVDWNAQQVQVNLIDNCTWESWGCEPCDWDPWFCDPWGGGGGGGGGFQICCTGPWVRGWALGDTRSLCCENAAQDASNQCNNSCCWGCCQYRACDALCLLGDCFCSCGVSGRMCESCRGGYCF